MAAVVTSSFLFSQLRLASSLLLSLRSSRGERAEMGKVLEDSLMIGGKVESLYKEVNFVLFIPHFLFSISFPMPSWTPCSSPLQMFTEVSNQ